MPNYTLLPIFPLPIVVFPGEEVRLHIFEPRYKQLIQDCLESGIVFVILPVIQSQIMPLGPLLKLIECSKLYSDGNMDIRLQCLSKMSLKKIINPFPGKMYGGADMVELKDEFTESETPLHEMVKNLFEQLCQLNHARPFHAIDWSQFQSYSLGHYVGFSIQQEYEFLCLKSEEERLQKLQQQITYMIQLNKPKREWLKRLQLNGEFLRFNPADWV